MPKNKGGREVRKPKKTKKIKNPEAGQSSPTVLKLDGGVKKVR